MFRSTLSSPRPSARRRPAVALAAVTSAVFALGLGVATASTGHADTVRGASRVGTTDGWYEGKTVTLTYQKDFFCDGTVPSGATSGCELGADANVPPRTGDLPELYVVVPLGFTPAASTLQCASASATTRCINHPATIDLSAAFGPAAANAFLPAHSHVMDERAGGWWAVEVVGVTTQAAWDEIVAGKDLDAVRAVQDAGAATGDLPTNLFLFFNVA